MSKTTNTAKKSCFKESKTVFWTPPLSSETLETSSQKVTPNSIEAVSMFLQQASPANPSVSQESKKAQTMKEICGRQLGTPFALYDPDTHCLKTSQGCLIADTSIESSVTFPKSGTMQDGRCWERTTLVPLTKGTDCGLWQTPSVEDASRTGSAEAWQEWKQKGRTTQCRLRNQVWPTPRSGKTTDENEETWKRRQARGDVSTPPLTLAVKMWPTPRNRMTGAVTPCRSTDKFNNLESVISRKQWPTPASRDYRNQHAPNSEAFKNRMKNPRGVNLVEETQRRGIQGQLNPDWVEWLMGWPVGWTSLEPMIELLWLDWSVDPADMEKPESYSTPCCGDILSTDGSLRPSRVATGRKTDYLARQAFWKKSYGPIPRVATGIKNRVNRLKAIGNGQVRECPALAWKVLTNEM